MLFFLSPLAIFDGVEIFMTESSVIAHIFGGLGNQLFCYAAAKRLAIKNNVPLKLDITSGFSHDRYKREYLLDRFNIQADTASASDSFVDRLGPFKRKLLFHFNRLLPFRFRTYLFEETPAFDQRLLEYKVRRRTYLSGYWQSDLYFRDIEDVLRRELVITDPISPESQAMAEMMRNSESVSIHVRSYSEVPAEHGRIILKSDYYNRGTKSIAERVHDPHYFCFSDDPVWLKQNLRLPYPMTIVECNNGKGYDGAVEDLWLMSRCRHHIIANSTFSWWGAWLNSSREKTVVMPRTDYLNSPGLNVSGWNQI